MVKALIGLIGSGLVLAGCMGGQKSDLAPLAKQMDGMVNAHNVDGFGALLTDDVVVKGPDGSMHNGKDSVKAWVASLMPGFHVESHGWQQSGDTLMWMATVHSDVFAATGVNPIKTHTLAVFAGGKLRYLAPSLTKETGNEMMLMQFYAQVINGRNIDAIDKFVAEDMAERGLTPPGWPRGRDGVKAYFKMVQEGFPDLHGTPSLVLADGDRVFVSGTWEGTNTGKFMGKPASNKKMSWTVADVVRIANGKAVEHWGWNDMPQRMAQPQAK